MKQNKITVVFFGCGFLASHILPNILPFCKKIIFIDKENIEPENYENSLYPKGFVNRRKVSALSTLTQLLTSIPTMPIHKEIKTKEDLNVDADFAFVTFDNIEGRVLANELTIPSISIGVTENYALIDWIPHVVLPTTPDEIERVKMEMKRVRDVCTRMEFRPLGSLAAALAGHAFYLWLTEKKKIAFEVSIHKGQIFITNHERK